jgi:hypothetical protein
MALFSAMQACARGVFGAAKVELLKHHAIINPASLTASPVESRPLSEWRRIGTLFRLKRILGGAERRATGEVQSKSSPFQTLRSHRLLFRTIMRQQKFPAGSVQAIAGLWRRRQEGISARRSDEDGYLPPCKHPHTTTAKFLDDSIMRDGLPDHWADMLGAEDVEVNELDESASLRRGRRVN